MNGIRFVHTDYLRLADSIAGLAAAPDWLRRLARDATRGAVSRVFEIARTHRADFVFIGGSCTESEEYQSSVVRWMKGPVQSLQQQGIQVVMSASPSSDLECLADFVVRPGERLHVTRASGHVRLGISRTDMPAGSELAVSPAKAGPSSHAACNYLFRPQTRHHIGTTPDGAAVHSAGAPQSHGPHEQGAFGCLVVEANPDSGHLDVVFQTTDPLRFETRNIDLSSVVTSQHVHDAVVEESRDLARQQRRTTVVDWHFETPLDCAGEFESWRQETILDSVRRTLQEGHLGVWPRRIEMAPSNVSLADRSESGGARELTTLLFERQRESHQEAHAIFAELITGARLLRRAA